jgi:hypothetical protein
MRFFKLANLMVGFGALLSLDPTAAFSADAISFGSLLKEKGLFYPGADAYHVVQSLTRKGEERTFITLIAEKAQSRIEIEIQSPIDAKEAKRISDSEYAVIRSLYGARQTPYAGEVSEAIACAEEDKPRTVRENFLGREEKVLLANAGARFTYGVCAKDLIALRGGFLTALRNGKYFELRFFQPATRGNETKEFQRLLKEIRSFKLLTGS